ncbi:MAG: NusG-like protein [Acidobacteria bacterium]|nr:NusG-like protein [Acidobacteriota bacterium]MCI0627712.1 NusG-like protein [Acidobacteriota bacterium]MCI0722435.1 NusG-like protein [Acidobacteriota bacterium]
MVASLLHSKGYEEFLPLYRSRRRWSDRMKAIEKPLFPGYVFCRFDVQKRLPILMTPGVRLIAGIGKTPLPVNDSEMAALQLIVQSGLQAEPWPFLQVGQRVRIERGSLQGVEGILMAIKKPYRLVVSVTLLQRSVAVELDGELAVAASSSPLLVSSRQLLQFDSALNSPGSQ